MTREDRIKWYIFNGKLDTAGYKYIAIEFLRPLLLAEKPMRKNKVRYQDVDAKFFGAGRRTSTRIVNGVI